MAGSGLSRRKIRRHPEQGSVVERVWGSETTRPREGGHRTHRGQSICTAASPAAPTASANPATNPHALPDARCRRRGCQAGAQPLGGLPWKAAPDCAPGGVPPSGCGSSRNRPRRGDGPCFLLQLWAGSGFGRAAGERRRCCGEGYDRSGLRHPVNRASRPACRPPRSRSRVLHSQPKVGRMRAGERVGRIKGVGFGSPQLGEHYASGRRRSSAERSAAASTAVR